VDLTFGDGLRASLATNLAAHERWSIPLEGRRHAAVAVVVVDSDVVAHGHDGDPDWPSVAGTAGGPAALLTRRAATLRAHARQWALPGGRIDPGERPVDAALREVREEVGIDLDESAVIGVLDDYATRSGYVITPFVLYAVDDHVVRHDPAEVLSVHRVALRELCRPDSPRFITIPESDRPVVQIPVGDDLIHAPTGAILLQFRRVAIEGVEERVVDLEQPVFAWK
jgi:8-oxo-dGTP pyrophosphatase MutT (NUDIX family)